MSLPHRTALQATSKEGARYGNLSYASQSRQPWFRSVCCCWSDSKKNVCMGLVTICIVNGKISTHPHIYKVLLNKILKKRNIAVFIQLNGECDNKFSCQSAVFGLFGFFHSIPELFPVIPFRWSHWRKHHFLIDQTLLSGIVKLNAVIIIVHAATAHISRSSENRKCGEISLQELRKSPMIWNCNHLRVDNMLLQISCSKINSFQKGVWKSKLPYAFLYSALQLV